MTNNVFLDKNVKTQQQQKQNIKHKNPYRSRELNPGPLAPNADELPLHHHKKISKLRVSIVVQLFNCFDAMGRNVNKQIQTWGHIFSTNLYLLLMFHCLNMVKM